MANMGEHSPYQTECLQKFPWQIDFDILMSFNNECRANTHLIQRYLLFIYLPFISLISTLHTGPLQRPPRHRILQNSNSPLSDLTWWEQFLRWENKIFNVEAYQDRTQKASCIQRWNAQLLKFPTNNFYFESLTFMQLQGAWGQFSSYYICLWIFAMLDLDNICYLVRINCTANISGKVYTICSAAKFKLYKLSTCHT